MGINGYVLAYAGVRAGAEAHMHLLMLCSK